MKRRKFLLASGTALLGGATVSNIQKPTVALEFTLSGTPSKKPSNINSVLIDFEQFKLTPMYLNKSETLDIQIQTQIDNVKSKTITKQIDLTNQQTITKSNLSTKLPIPIDGINTTKESIEGQVIIKISHSSLGEKQYKQSFTITDNPLINGLVAYYPIFKNGSAIIHDAIGDNIGQVENASWSSSSVVSNSIKFDNDNEQIDIGDTGIGTLDNWTVSYWAYPDSNQTDSSASWKGVVSNGDANNDNGWSCHYKHDVTDWVITHSDDYPYNSGLNVTAPADTDEWQLVTWTYDGDKVRIYKDSTLIDSDSGSQTYESDTDNLFIGKYIWKGEHRYWDGKIDDIRIYNKALSSTEINDLYNISEPSGTKITENDVPNQDDGGIARYQLENNGSDNTIPDSWGSNDGTDYTSSGYSTGVYGKSKSFDGSSDYIKLPNSIVAGQSEITMSCWMLLEQTPTSYDGIIHNSGGSIDQDIGIMVQENGTYHVEITTDTDNNIDPSGGSINMNNWEFLTLTWSSSTDTMKFYVNGDERISKTVSGNSVADPNYNGTMIGKRTDVEDYFGGKIDDVRIYNKELSQSQVQQLFKLGSYQIKSN